MVEFKEISFPSSYVGRRKGGLTTYACDRPDCQIDGGKLLFEFIIKNKFQKIIDFGTWSGGSVICEAQALQELADRTGLNANEDPYHKDMGDLISDATTVIDKNEVWSLYPEKTCETFSGEINVFDQSWDGEGQNGNIGATLNNIKKYECYKNVQFNLKKMDIWEWIKNPDSFDFLHIDVGNSPENILKIVDALSDQINEGGVIIFNGGALRYHYAPFGTQINEDGIDVSHTMVSLGHPDNYQKLKDTGLDFLILTQEYPGFICIDRRIRMSWPLYLREK